MLAAYKIAAPGASVRGSPTGTVKIARLEDRDLRQHRLIYPVR